MIRELLGDRFGQIAIQSTIDQIETLWVLPSEICRVIRFLKYDIPQPFQMLYDLTAIDERTRDHRMDQPASAFTIVYHLLSFERNVDLRIKVALGADAPAIDSIIRIFPAAAWYECEIFDMFGVLFNHHPNLRRLLMPANWKGHPLRKDHPARATELPPYTHDNAIVDLQQDLLKLRPEQWGWAPESEENEYIYLNLGPQHPGTHGLLRFILKLDGEVISESIADIGYHHRGAEKMGERQTWHSFIPYTDRIDYLGGVMNNLPYLLAVEKLAGITVPPRAQMIRVMMCELFRIISHLVWYGTFVQDIGFMSPVFYMFTDRERAFRIVEAICGGRMHPMWFRIGGVAHDLPTGWEQLVRDFIAYLPAQLNDYDQAVMKNRIFTARTKGIGAYSRAEAIEWGVTGPGLRACGMDWDFRKKRPYSGYEAFSFDIPIAHNGDCFDRAVVRIEEMRQSLRIIEQCVNNMPAGDYKADHPLAMPPRKDKTMLDIETLIHHFVGVSWGPIMPPGEAFAGIEATKGNTGYYLISDGKALSYRTRIRTPSFAHVQMAPGVARGMLVSDLLAYLGSIDFVLADIDR